MASRMEVDNRSCYIGDMTEFKATLIEVDPGRSGQYKTVIIDVRGTGSDNLPVTLILSSDEALRLGVTLVEAGMF